MEKCANDLAPSEEWVAPVGFCNTETEHVLLSFYNPQIINVAPQSAQIVLTLDGAISLRAELDSFLKQNVTSH